MPILLIMGWGGIIVIGLIIWAFVRIPFLRWLVAGLVVYWLGSMLVDATVAWVHTWAWWGWVILIGIIAIPVGLITWAVIADGKKPATPAPEPAKPANDEATRLLHERFNPDGTLRRDGDPDLW